MNIIVDFIDRLARFGLETVIHRYYSIYQGKVISVSDKDKMGRIQVAVPVVTGNETRPITNWALPVALLAGNNYGVFFSPKVGDWVYVFFSGGDASYPFYFGGWWGEAELPSEMQSDPPEVRGIKTPAGHKILFGDKAGSEYIELDDKDGNKIRFDCVAKTIEIQNSGGSMYIKYDLTSGKMTIEATEIDLGNMASDFAILGTTFLPLLNAHQHLGNLGFPTGPVMVPIPPTVLSTKVKVK